MSSLCYDELFRQDGFLSFLLFQQTKEQYTNAIRNIQDHSTNIFFYFLFCLRVSRAQDGPLMVLTRHIQTPTESTMRAKAFSLSQCKTKVFEEIQLK